MAGATGLEPATSAVTGQRSNQLSYAPVQGKAKLRGISSGSQRVMSQNLSVRGGIVLGVESGVRLGCSVGIGNWKNRAVGGRLSEGGRGMQKLNCKM